MLSVNGIFKKGVARPLKNIEDHENNEVIISFLDEDSKEDLSPDDEYDGDTLIELIEECKMETGIGDLAHEHDHYLYETPNRVNV
jgi:hypothetical protein